MRSRSVPGSKPAVSSLPQVRARLLGLLAGEAEERVGGQRVVGGARPPDEAEGVPRLLDERAGLAGLAPGAPDGGERSLRLLEGGGRARALLVEAGGPLAHERHVRRLVAAEARLPDRLARRLLREVVAPATWDRVGHHVRLHPDEVRPRLAPVEGALGAMAPLAPLVLRAVVAGAAGLGRRRHRLV